MATSTPSREMAIEVMARTSDRPGDDLLACDVTSGAARPTREPLGDAAVSSGTEHLMVMLGVRLGSRTSSVVLKWISEPKRNYNKKNI